MRKYKVMEFSSAVSQKNMVLREPSPIDSFHNEITIGEDDGEESVTFCNPIVMLFNQMRLDNIGEQSLRQWLEGQPEDSALKEILSKCNPEDVMATIKSRYLQSPSEIRAWAEYTAHNMEKFNNELKSALEAQQATKTEEVPKTE